MLKHTALRWREGPKRPIKPFLHQQKHIQVSREESVCDKAAPDECPLKLPGRMGQAQQLIETICQRLTSWRRGAEAFEPLAKVSGKLIR
jgi:hypothetical protein